MSENFKSKIKAIYLPAVNYAAIRIFLARGKINGCGIVEVSFKEPCVLFNFDAVVNYEDGTLRVEADLRNLSKKTVKG